MKSGHLRAASKQFMACASDEACPEAVRTDCMELYSAVERVTPTVIFSVVDEQGSDVTAGVKVFSGDQLLLEGLDGRAIPVDPGSYAFRIELPWGETVQADVLIREGEKNRVVSVKVVDPNKQPTDVPAPAATGVMDSTLPPPEPNRTPPGFWIASGVGVAALATGAVFELMGRSKHSDLADCSPTCDRSQKDEYDAMKRDYLIGDVTLGVGVVSVGVAAVIFFTSGNASPAQEATLAKLRRVQVLPARRGQGATVVLTTTTF